MSCAQPRRLLDAWLDGELDAATRAQIGEHLEGCAACGALRAEREVLRDTIRRAGLREPAPSRVADAVRGAIARAAQGAPLARHRPTWWQSVALAAVCALLAVLATLTLVRPDPLDAVVAGHVAALARAQGQPERLVQVTSADGHTVRPWFAGKVDFSPPVRDLSAQGFTLLGGRLDRVGDRIAAVIVYRIRNHPVDLFVTTQGPAPTAATRLRSSRGFGVAEWSADGLAFAAVSDVDAHDLERFAAAMRARQPGAGMP
jgi:anti-sigma factor RsiW